MLILNAKFFDIQHIKSTFQQSKTCKNKLTQALRSAKQINDYFVMIISIDIKKLCFY